MKFNINFTVLIMKNYFVNSYRNIMFQIYVQIKRLILIKLYEKMSSKNIKNTFFIHLIYFIVWLKEDVRKAVDVWGRKGERNTKKFRNYTDIRRYIFGIQNEP